MKKYLWIVALVAALTMVFAGCGDGDSGGGSDVTITFDVNTPATYEGPSITAPDPVKIKSGAAIGTLPAAPSGTGDYGLTFNGWFTAKTGGTLITPSSTFSTSTTVYAQWTEFNPDTDVAISFNLNYEGAPANIIVTGKVGEALGDKWPADPTRPGTVKGKENDNDSWAFIAWVQYDSGGGGPYTSETVLPGSIIDNTVWAKWGPSTGWPLDVLPPGMATSGVEKVILENAWYPAYYFELPAGKTWGDFNGITFDVMVGPESIDKGNSCRGIRLMGNYKNSDFELLPTAGVGNYPDGIMVAPYASSGTADTNKNAPYILNDLAQAWKTIGQALADMGEVPEIWKWFTISHKIDGSNKNGSYDDANKPADSATGPFIFGVAITSQAGGGTSEWIKDVTLVGNFGTDSVKAKPLYFSEGGKTYPAFLGWASTASGDGLPEAYRGMEDGSTPVAVPK
jgi:predicted small secreted protein